MYSKLRTYDYFNRLIWYDSNHFPDCSGTLTPLLNNVLGDFRQASIQYEQTRQEAAASGSIGQTNLRRFKKTLC